VSHATRSLTVAAPFLRAASCATRSLTVAALFLRPVADEPKPP